MGAIGLVIGGATEADDRSENQAGGSDVKVVFRKLPELTVFEKEGRTEGVSAAYGGVVGKAVIVAGGCNFPGVSAAEGGPKVYYREIYRLVRPGSEGEQWVLVGYLPEKAANGASVTLREGVVCMGGKNAEGSLKTVWLLTGPQADGNLQLSRLPDLPVAMDDFAAATAGGRIYVAGGNADGQPANRCFILDGIQATAWKELPAFPGIHRLQPVAFVRKGKFYLMGGFQPVLNGQECVVATDGVCYDPRSGEWTLLGDIRPDGGKEAFALVGASGQPWGEHKMVFTGGVNRQVFKAAVDNPLLTERALADGRMNEVARLRQEKADYLKHLPQWYQFNPDILIYDAAADTWTKTSGSPVLARAGAVMVAYEDSWVVVNGETKPGIRSSGACIFRLDK